MVTRESKENSRLFAIAQKAAYEPFTEDNRFFQRVMFVNSQCFSAYKIKMRGEMEKSGRVGLYIAPRLTKTWNCRSQATFVAFVGNNWNKGREKGQFLFHCNLQTDGGRCDVAEGAKGQVSFH